MSIIFVGVFRDKKVEQEIAFSDDDWNTTMEKEYSGFDRSYERESVIHP